MILAVWPKYLPIAGFSITGETRSPGFWNTIYQYVIRVFIHHPDGVHYASKALIGITDWDPGGPWCAGDFHHPSSSPANLALILEGGPGLWKQPSHRTSYFEGIVWYFPGYPQGSQGS